MEYQEAEAIFKVIKSAKQQRLLDMFLKSAVRYARLRVDWHFADHEGRIALDEERTRAHEALISNCNALARNMKDTGEDDSWRKKLGNDRKEIGDFACLIHALMGTSAR